MLGRSSSFALAILCAGLLLVTGCSQEPHPKADLVLTGGRVVTLGEDAGHTTAIASLDGKIVALGSDKEIDPWIGPETRVLPVDGKLVIPGLIEGHGHFFGWGQSLLNVDLAPYSSWDDIVEELGRVAMNKPAGAWIVGRGWHQEKWDTPPSPAVEGNPVHDSLSAATPNHPVLLVHASGHASIANAKAMELAGIDRNTPDPEGGTIIRDANGRATGTLRERATQLVQRVYGKYLASLSSEERVARANEAIRLASEASLANGITSFQDAGSSFEVVELLREAAKQGELGVRLWMMIRESNETLAEKLPGYRVYREGNNHITVGGLKRSIDGALGSHGAWLLEPYTDLPSSSGLNTVPLDAMNVTAQLAKDHDLQFCVHAIGDRANRETMDIFENAFDSPQTLKEKRWRVEHAQHLNLDEIPRFAELGVIASMQTVHCTSDGPWVPIRLGDTRSSEGAYVWRKLIDSGAHVINGTDVPVENIDPIANFHAAVTRIMRTGEPFYPDQSMTRLEALRSATIDAAWAAFEDDIKGSLEVGKLADITVLSDDILEIPLDELNQTRVEYTIVAGEVRYEYINE